MNLRHYEMLINRKYIKYHYIIEPGKQYPTIFKVNEYKDIFSKYINTQEKNPMFKKSFLVGEKVQIIEEFKHIDHNYIIICIIRRIDNTIGCISKDGLT